MTQRSRATQLAALLAIWVLCFPDATIAQVLHPIPETPAPPAPSVPVPAPADQRGASAGPIIYLAQPATSPTTARDGEWVSFYSTIVWSLTFIAFISFVSFNQRIGRMLGLTARIVRKIKYGGLEMEISADAVDQIRSLLTGSIDELIAKARLEYDRMADLMNIYTHLERCCAALAQILENHGLDKKVEGLRATVYTRDIIFSDYLYQLVDYYPVRSGAAGRRFSQRFGIIGRSWRSHESLSEGDAMSGDDKEHLLVREWGMTKHEAAATSRARPSYATIILKGGADSGALPIGVLFIDSTKTDAFGDGDVAQKVIAELADSFEVIILAKALDQAIVPLRVAAPNIDIGQYGYRG